MSGGLLDTSTLIFLPRLAAPELPSEAVISAVTLAELTLGPLVAKDDQARAQRLYEVQDAAANFEPLPFDAAAAQQFGLVAASLRRAGRKAASRGFDAMIAAVAMAHHLPLYTCNPKDFEGIDGLEVIPVPHPDAGRSSPGG